MTLSTNKTNHNCTTASSDGAAGGGNGSGEEATERKWIFNLIVNHPILPFERLAVIGGCKSLGNWQPEHAILMDYQETHNHYRHHYRSGVSGLWTMSVNLPKKEKIPYRYFICYQQPKTHKILIRYWETHFDIRMIAASDVNNTSNEEQWRSEDIFGIVNNVEKIERGWLTSEWILELKLFNDAIRLPENLKKCNIYVKVTPKRIEGVNEKNEWIFKDIVLPEAFVEVARLIYGKSKFHMQNEYGILFVPKDDFIIFHATVSNNFASIGYLLEIFALEVDNNKTTQLIGYNYILPSNLSQSEGQFDLPILNVNNESPIGVIMFNYLIIKPMQSTTSTIIEQNMKITFMTFWKTNWKGLNIGHRGSGTSYKVKGITNYPENTIASIKHVAFNGADIAEIDVHLTKNLIPIVYHDFQVNISLSNDKIPKDTGDLIEIPVKDLTLKELKNSKIYHVCSEGTITRHCPSERTLSQKDVEENIQSEDYESFVTLEKLLDILEPNIAIDIEVKWPQPFENGEMEGKRQTIDKNVYVNKILEIVLNRGRNNGRYIILTSFDVDICTLLRFKQNVYPVMFLVLGSSDRYPLYADPRSTNNAKAVCYVQTMDLLGVILHSEDLLNNSSWLNFAKKLKQIVFCWGDDSRVTENLLALKEMGLDGVIYDRCEPNLRRTTNHPLEKSNFRNEAKLCMNLLKE